MQFQKKHLSLKGAVEFTSSRVVDNRGWFSRIFDDKAFGKVIPNVGVKQINLSFSESRGTLRGLHFLKSPANEYKVVCCVHGKIFDVIVDLRKGSATYGHHHKVELSGENKKMILIPPGFAHGFQTLEDMSQLLYLHSEEYNVSLDAGFHYASPDLGISWPLDVTEISRRDDAQKQFVWGMTNEM